MAIWDGEHGQRRGWRARGKLQETACGHVKRRRYPEEIDKVARPSGSRFACLGGIVAETSGEEGMDGEHVAVLSALDAMDEVACCRPPSPVNHRPNRPDSEALQEFWAGAGYASPASRVWEKGATAGEGEATFVDECRV